MSEIILVSINPWKKAKVNNYLDKLMFSSTDIHSGPSLAYIHARKENVHKYTQKKHWEGQGMVKAKFVRTATIFIHYFRIQLLRIREGLKSWLGTEQMPLSLIHGSLLYHYHQESNYGQSPWDHLLSCLRSHQVGPHIKADQKQAVVVRGLEESL